MTGAARLAGIAGASRSRDLAWELPALALLIAVAVFGGFNRIMAFDDAHFFVRYAGNILAGHGYAWNPGGPPADGITSPAWLGVVVAAKALRNPTANASGDFIASLSQATGIALLVALYAGSRMFLGARQKSLALLAPAFFVLGPFPISGVINTGMETVFASLTLIGYLAALARLVRPGEGPSRARALIALTSAGGLMLVLSRPEFGLIALGAPVLAALTVRGLSAPHRRALVLGVVGLLVLLGLLALLRLRTFGHLMPLAYYIKSASAGGAPYEDYDRWMYTSLKNFPFVYFRDSVLLHGVLLAGLLLHRRLRALAWLLAPLYACIAYFSTTLQIMGYNHRYYFPFTCALAVVAAMAWRSRDADAEADAGAAAADESDAPPSLLAEVSAPRLAGSVAAVSAILLALFAAHPAMRAAAFQFGPEAMNPRVTRVVREFPKGATIAATEVGELGSRCPHVNIIDCAGLNDLEFARGFTAEKLFAKPPDAIALIHGHYGGMWRRIREHPAFKDYEVVVNFTPERGDSFLDTTIRIRRDSPFYAEMKAAAQRAPRH